MIYFSKTKDEESVDEKEDAVELVRNVANLKVKLRIRSQIANIIYKLLA